jgi:hypothetical protein
MRHVAAASSTAELHADRPTRLLTHATLRKEWCDVALSRTRQVIGLSFDTGNWTAARHGRLRLSMASARQLLNSGGKPRGTRISDLHKSAWSISLPKCRS